MTELDIGQTSTQKITIDDTTIDSNALDGPENQDKAQEFPEATTNFGIYKSVGELKKAIDALAIWTAGKGFEADNATTVILDGISGWGEDSFQSILQNMITVKKVVGDSFAEIIRNPKTGTLINLKPISPERMRIIIGSNGLIKRYEQINTKGRAKKLTTDQVLHLCNERIGDETHGVSAIDAVKWVVEAINEARRDYRKVLHRNVVPLRIIEVDSDDSAKIATVKAQYKDAEEKGEVLVIPKGTVSIENETINVQDPIAWLTALENLLYQALGVPRIIATSEGFTEAGGKVGFLTFEPIYTNEQTLLEQDLWNQMGVKIKFNRPPSLSGVTQQDEEKNTGQLGIQPKDTEATVERE